jgi:uncharacterized phage protein (TIGR01671 family)
MRDFKFRAWDKTNEQMIEGIMAICSGEGGWVLFTAEVQGLDCGRAIHDIQQYEIMQFTGLVDKHGKDIFEGDVVTDGEHRFKGIVFFENGAFWVREVFSHVEEGLFDDREQETRWSINLDWEVIGNSWEHPRLFAQEMNR